MTPQQKAAQYALGALVADLHVEASVWPDTRAALIRQTADALDGIRIRTILGDLSTEDASAWLDAGRLTLAELRYHRCLGGNSALDRMVGDRL